MIPQRFNSLMILIISLFFVMGCNDSGRPKQLAGASSPIVTETVDTVSAEETASIPIPESSEDILTSFKDGLSLPPNADETVSAYHFALTTLVLEQAKERPEIIAGMWKIFLECRLNDSSVSDESALGLMTMFLDTVDKALLNCPDRKTFDGVWQVRLQIMTRQKSVLDNFCKACTVELSEQKEAAGIWVRNRFVADSKEEIPPFQSVVERCKSLEFYIEETSYDIASHAAYIQARQDLATAIQLEIANQVKKLQTTYDSVANQTHNVAEHGTPTPARAEEVYTNGPLQLLSVEIQTAVQLLSSEDLSYFMQDVSSDTLAGLVSLMQDTAQLQRIRYNLWANIVVYQVQQRGKPRTDLAKLSEISGEVLYPAIHSQYSELQSEMLRAITDPRDHQIQNRKMVLAKKVPLSAF